VPIGVQGSRGAIELVPVKIQTTEAAREQAADAELPTQLAPGASSAGSTPGPDALQAQLQVLAKLRQPDSDRTAPPQSAPDAELLTTSDNAAPGELAALRDFIRDQVERHWSLNLTALGAEDFSIPIRIEITSNGTVLKAELVGTARSMDPVYGEVAASARNAVLSASPLSLPAGDYRSVTKLILYLNPRDTLR
jgi:hypothetical protein